MLINRLVNQRILLCKSRKYICFQKNYVNSSNHSSKDREGHNEVQKLMNEVASHPNVMKAMQTLFKIMENKGLTKDQTDKQLSPWKMVRVIIDKDVRSAMQELRDELKKAGITLGQEQLTPLMKVLGLNKSK